MNVLLVSAYELGRQPLHLAAPAAKLRASGHRVQTLDISIEELDLDLLDGVGGVAFSVPMHTAMRLAIAAAKQIRAVLPRLPIVFYGLYAAVGKEHTLGNVADALFVGEYESNLLEWANSGACATGVSVDIGPSRFSVPDRSHLSPLSSYARLEWQGKAKVVGAVEASHGCRHRCRHCPIPVTYDGRLRVVGKEVVLADIDQQAEAGAEHVTFGDPDFLNAPRYSLDILVEAHRRHPNLTFDVTVKVSHILMHNGLWPRFRELGLLFVVSAFESVDQTTLDVLDKNHTVDDMVSAVGLVRSAGIHIRPTWLPFFPWTTVGDIAAIVSFLDEQRLWESTDPVQMAIKLLIPEGSLLESHRAVIPHLTAYNPGSLTWDWEFANPGAERLFKELDAIASQGSDCGAEAIDVIDEMRNAIATANGRHPGPRPIGAPAPRLTESWFCCAEPTASQAITAGLRIGSVSSSIDQRGRV